MHVDSCVHDLSPSLYHNLFLFILAFVPMSHHFRSEPKVPLQTVSLERSAVTLTVTLVYPTSLRQSRLKSGGDWSAATSVYMLVYVALLL